jgi:lipoyl(octanoyl) transferase
VNAPAMLDLLPTRADSAAANMAADFLLLKRYPARDHARLRAYGWHRPAFSFGYSQKIASVRAALPAEAPEGAELVRRPTGGGLVDHRDDWTYALVLPRGHALETARALDSYRAVHDALATALRACGQPAALKDRCESACSDPQASGLIPPPSASAPPTLCFTRPELFDVVHPDTGQKIAGAAQKRTKEGLLFQGSLLRAAAPCIQDYDTLYAAFAAALGLAASEAPWPDFPEGELEALTEHYASSEWRDSR